MSAMKRYLEDVAVEIDNGNRAKVEELLGTWSNEDKINILLEAIELNGIIGPVCQCDKQSAAECLHDWGVEKGVSFCLDCGEFEDYLATPEETNA